MRPLFLAAGCPEVREGRARTTGSEERGGGARGAAHPHPQAEGAAVEAGTARPAGMCHETGGSVADLG